MWDSMRKTHLVRDWVSSDGEIAHPVHFMSMITNDFPKGDLLRRSFVTLKNIKEFNTEWRNEAYLWDFFWRQLGELAFSWDAQPVVFLSHFFRNCSQLEYMYLTSSWASCYCCLGNFLYTARMNTGQHIYTVLKLSVISVNLGVEQEHSNAFGFDNRKVLYCKTAWTPKFLH